MAWTHAFLDPSNLGPGGQARVNLLQNAQNPTSIIENRDDIIRRGSTITRVVGSLWVRPADASSVSEGVFGLAMVESDAEAASAVPDPTDDTAFPWMHWERFVVGSEATGELATGDWIHFKLDIKAQRKMKSRRDALNLIMNNDDGTHSFSFALGLRVLIRMA